MMTAVAYFEGPQPDGVRRMLRTWLECYERSGTRFRPCLLLDRGTPIPDFWRYATVRLAEPEPPFREHVLQKADWMKVQAFEYLGKSLVLDLDALVVKPLDDLERVESAIALAPDPGRRTYEQWPEVGEELNIGVMLLNSPRVFPVFRERFEQRRAFAKLPWFGQLILSEFCRAHGELLDERLNWSHWHGELPADVSVVHFHGNGKQKLEAFARDWLRSPSEPEGEPRPASVRRGSTIAIRYRGRFDDGTVFDEATELVDVTIGAGQMAEALEAGLLGAAAGERRSIPLPAEAAFGPRRVDLVVDVERAVLPPHFRVEVGESVTLPTEAGELQGRIAGFDRQRVRVDANHPYAGRDVTYDVEVVAVR